MSSTWERMQAVDGSGKLDCRLRGKVKGFAQRTYEGLQLVPPLQPLERALYFFGDAEVRWRP